MTFELARLPEARRPERLNERQWYRPGYAVGDPGDMSCPWMLRDEFYLLERVSGLSDDARALAFRLVAGMATAVVKVLRRVVERIKGLLRSYFAAGDPQDETETSSAGS